MPDAGSTPGAQEFKAHFALMLFGAPGSGKGTAGTIVAKQLSLPHISTGDLLRAQVAADGEIGEIGRASCRERV